MITITGKHFDCTSIAGRFVQGEANADVYKIHGDRYDDAANDLSALSWVMQGANSDHDVLVQKSVACTVDTDDASKITFTWTVDPAYVAMAGKLELHLMGSNSAGTLVCKYTSGGVSVDASLTGSMSAPTNPIDEAMAQLAVIIPQLAQAHTDATAAAAAAAAAAQSNTDASTSASAAAASATSAAGSATTAEEWAKTAAGVSGFKGWYADAATLRAAYPDASGQVGWFAICGSTDTVWVWDAETTAWKDSGSGTIDLSNYYNKTQSDARYATAAQGAKADAALQDATAFATAAQGANADTALQDAAAASTAAAAASAAAAAVKTEVENTITFLLPSDAWVGTAAPYTQSVSVTGVTASMNPVADVVLMDDTSNLARLTAWACVGRIVCGDGTVTVTCYEEKTTVGIYVRLKGLY